MLTPIRLIVGLGNPGPKYQKTRHNAGAWFVEALARHQSISLKPESKFHASIAKVREGDHECTLFIPSTYMNESGLAVRSFAHFYKIPAESILIAHDELDFEPGITRLKHSGGHGGHNGLRNIHQCLKTNNYHRLIRKKSACKTKIN